MDKKEISKRMHEQDHRSTQYPLYVIRVDQHIPATQYDEWGYDGRERSENFELETLCESCLELHNSGSDLPEDCDECGDCFNYYRIEKAFDLTAGVFFTEKACLDHIEANKYHYKNPDCYVVGAWRNEEMQTIMQDILKCTNEKIPNHYQ